jgi:hypothetical protein
VSLRDRFFAFDDALAARGVPPMTAWWREGVGGWLDRYEHDHVLELWACVGRGAAKSTALYKLALFFALFGEFVVPPGERHFAIVLSRLKEEASKGVDIISRWLVLLGVPHHPSGDVIELDDMPRGIRVVAASVAATSGWRAFFVGRDERSKWSTSGTEEREADEVDTSATAMTATHAFAPNVSFGSAWTKTSGFYDIITAGSNDARIVLGPAPTWVAAPHISEESTHRKEKNPRRWAREYACVSQDGAAAVFADEDIDVAFEPRTLGAALGPKVIVIDASSGRKDTFSYAVAGWVRGEVATRESVPDLEGEVDHEPSAEELSALFLQIAAHATEDRAARTANAVLRFYAIDGFDPEQARRLGVGGIVAKIARVARQHGAVVVHGDQREAFALATQFRAAGLRFRSHDWTSTSKPAAIELVRRWFQERALALPKHERLRRELLSFDEKIAPSGAFTYGGRGNSHDDYVALLLTAAMATLVGGLRGSSGGGHRPQAPDVHTYRSQTEF